VPPKGKLFLREDEEPPQAIIEVEMDDEEDMFLESTLDSTSFTSSSFSSSTSPAPSSTSSAMSNQRVKDKKKLIIQFAQIEDTGARLRAGGRFFV
jgi:CCR4-NOT transcriptional regulation complex NOT5 subunit